MAPARDGDSVKVHYTGTLDDGTVFDSSEEEEPLEFTIGKGEIIPGFEEAVMGMDPGASKTIKIPADKAYGPHLTEMVMDVDLSRFPEGFDPKVGDSLQIPQPDDEPVSATVQKISDSKVTLDANHPLAGKDLSFEIRLVSVG